MKLLKLLKAWMNNCHDFLNEKINESVLTVLQYYLNAFDCIPHNTRHMIGFPQNIKQKQTMFSNNELKWMIYGNINLLQDTASERQMNQKMHKCNVATLNNFILQIDLISGN